MSDNDRTKQQKELFAKDQAITGFIADMYLGDIVTLGENIQIQLQGASNRRAKLRILAPDDVIIKRDSNRDD